MLTLDERSAYANSQKADVFVSIHANAAMRPTMKGAEVYYLSLDRDRRRAAPQAATDRRRAADARRRRRARST